MQIKTKKPGLRQGEIVVINMSVENAETENTSESPKDERNTPKTVPSKTDEKQPDSSTSNSSPKTQSATNSRPSTASKDSISPNTFVYALWNNDDKLVRKVRYNFNLYLIKIQL